jgi:hypothetical protein
MPMRSQSPRKYRPRLFPACVPCSRRNPTTSDRRVQASVLASTSIQCAVIPRYPALVVSAVQPSAVVDTFPGADYKLVSTDLVWEVGFHRKSYLYLFFEVFQMRDVLIMDIGFDVMCAR